MPPSRRPSSRPKRPAFKSRALNRPLLRSAVKKPAPSNTPSPSPPPPSSPPPLVDRQQFRHDSILRINSPHPPLSGSDQDEYPSSPPPDPLDAPQSAPSEHQAVTPPPVTFPKVRKTHGYDKLQHGVMHNTPYYVLRVPTDGITVSGSMWMSVILGQANIFGTTLTAAHPPVLIVSAPIAPYLLTLQACSSSQHIQSPCHSSVPTANRTHPESISHLKIKSSFSFSARKHPPDHCLFLLTAVSAAESVWEAADSFQPSADISHTTSFASQFGFPSLVPGERLLPGMSVFPRADKFPLFEVWDAWQSCAAKTTAFLASVKAKSDFRLLACGPGGTGKSTFTRCIINHFLFSRQPVVLIDTDLGQPEMNLPGLVAAHVVSDMRIGSPVASNRGVPLSARYLGEATPREDPDLYAQYVEEVCRDAISFAKEHDYPIVANSDGWLTGIGADLFRHFARQIGPSHVAQLRFGGRSHSPIVLEVASHVEEDFRFDIESPRRGREGNFSTVVSRDLHLATYFSKEISLGRVYSAFLENMTIVNVCDTRHETSVSPLALNTCIVALAEGISGGVPGVQEWTVRGFGVVRGVSSEEKMLYICTPLPMHVLDDCDGILIGGSIQLPRSLFVGMAVANPAMSEKAPYILKGSILTGESMRSRASLVRNG